MKRFLSLFKDYKIMICVYIISLCILCCVCINLQAINNKKVHAFNYKEEPIKQEIPMIKIEEPVIKKQIVISAVGDIMVHGPQLKAQYNKEKNIYDFNNNFSHIKKYFEDSDLNILNFETTLAGSEEKYSSFPKFNSPDELVDSLKNVGFNIFCLNNNHSLDKRSKGIFRTLDVMKNKDIISTGIRNEVNDKKYIIYNKNDIKVGLISYTYQIKDTLNGNPITNDVANLINTFDYYNLDKSFEDMKANIEDIKKENVDLIIFQIHWGNEYMLEPNSYQKKIAKFLSDQGVDIIFGTHPHVVQPFYKLESEVSNKNTYVFYSLGNFISNQRYEILKQRNSEAGIIVRINIEKKDGNIVYNEVNYIPTWVNKYSKDNKSVYEIVPLYNLDENKEKFNLLYKDNLWRAKNAQDFIKGMMNKNNFSIVKY